MRQMALDLPLRPARGRTDFFVAPSNAAALAAVDGWRGWPQGRLVLTGPAGSGKTHLAEVWRATMTGAAVLTAAALRAGDVPGLAAAGAVVVEDADRAAGQAAAEAALFHLLNLAAAEGAAVLVTGRGAVQGWGLALPDLESRLVAAASARIEAPDEGLMAAVMVKLFADRQVEVTPAAVEAAVARLDRDLAAVGALVAAVDRLALAERRAVTRGLVLRVLDSRGRPGEDARDPAPEGPGTDMP